MAAVSRCETNVPKVYNSRTGYRFLFYSSSGNRNLCPIACEKRRRQRRTATGVIVSLRRQAVRRLRSLPSTKRGEIIGLRELAQSFLSEPLESFAS